MYKIKILMVWLIFPCPEEFSLKGNFKHKKRLLLDVVVYLIIN